MVSKTRRKARKSIEAMREMLGENSDNDENHLSTQNISDNAQPLLNPTSTTRLESEDQFERLSQRIDTRINEGLTSSLTQFEAKLETALECIRRTVTNSLGARSQVLTDQDSDVDREYGSVGVSRIQQNADLSIQGSRLDLDHPHVGGNSKDAGQVWIGSQTSLREENNGEVYLSNPHLSVERNGTQNVNTGTVYVHFSHGDRRVR